MRFISAILRLFGLQRARQEPDDYAGTELARTVVRGGNIVMQGDWE